MHAPFLMSSVRSLDTLWSLVCAKGECPGEEVQRSAKPFGSRVVQGQEEPRTGGRKEMDQGLSANPKNQARGRRASRPEGGVCGWTQLRWSFFPAKEVVTVYELGAGSGYRGSTGRCAKSLKAQPNSQTLTAEQTGSAPSKHLLRNCVAFDLPPVSSHPALAHLRWAPPRKEKEHVLRGSQSDQAWTAAVRVRLPW